MQAQTPQIAYETVMTDLTLPWDMAFLPDGTMFYTEKCDGLSVKMPDGSINGLLGMNDSSGYAVTANDLFCEGQAGMMGVATDPDFNENRLIYVYSTSSMTAPGTNRLMRLRVSDNFASVSNRTDIISDVPYKPEATDQPIIAEHGPWHSDEITALVPGGNGGWDPRPNRAGRGSCPDGYCGYEPVQMEGMDPAERAAYMPMTDLESFPDAMQPLWTNSGLSQGMTANEFLRGPHWGAWEGRMVVGFMGIGFGGTPVGQRINVITLAADGSAVQSVIRMPLPMGQGRIRSLVVAPDGHLYAAIDEGDIYRIYPVQH